MRRSRPTVSATQTILVAEIRAEDVPQRVFEWFVSERSPDPERFLRDGGRAVAPNLRWPLHASYPRKAASSTDGGRRGSQSLFADPGPWNTQRALFLLLPRALWERKREGCCGMRIRSESSDSAWPTAWLSRRVPLYTQLPRSTGRPALDKHVSAPPQCHP
ncbi:hypothetical protein MIND_01282300 [Mycena indigotica]|uniref:Uncharacterized protein n=1 Tax=Mycena indigotica TaxID=2126181 RepID=A0A8H6VV93_9AGAR|nr:uncharacterized protein MIND_01282300 [Mycena indigotica]KAF7291378.1 hypothetical protein MIND_01282300 [Mycena indigotica]